jgi:3'-phosphoadenosine 5'-phosphosulfate sulfotransferase (PAPS reductase)/FAD synthetase
MKHIVSFSGGKDSTCMLLMMLEKGMPIDDIIFCDTGMEFPAMYDHIAQVEKFTGRKITRLQNPKGFMYYFKEHQKSKGKYMDQLGFGWPNMKIRWCTARLKQDVFKRYLKDSLKGRDHIEYHGIAYDEPKRIEKNQGRNIQYPLFEWGIVEAEALKYCYDRGFTWNGLYKQFRRVSCWCCPLKGLDELYALYTHYPELWAELLEMDKKSWRSFRADYSLKQLEKRFKHQEKHDKFLEKLRLF